MISSLPSNGSSSEFDPFSFAGKAALLAGSTYGLYRTFGGRSGLSSSSLTGINRYSNQLKGALRAPGYSFPEKKFSELDLIPFGNIVQPPRHAQIYNSAEEVISQFGATSGLQSLFTNEIGSFHKALTDKGYRDIRYQVNRLSSGAISEIAITPRGAGTTFRLNPITSKGTIYLGGANPIEYTARKMFDIGPAGEAELVDISTGVAREYQRNLGDIIPNYGQQGFRATKSATDILRRGHSTAVYEGVGPGAHSGAVAGLRKHEVMLDPFKKMSTEGQMSLLKQYAGRGLLEVGHPSMTASAIGYLPGSPLSQDPGAIYSIAAGKQRFRPTEFISGGRDLSAGFGSNSAKEFSLGVIDPAKFINLQGAAKTRIEEINTLLGSSTPSRRRSLLRERGRLQNLLVGELAEEEMIMSRATNIRARNQINVEKIDISKGITPEFKSVMDKIKSDRGFATDSDLMAALSREGGISGLNIPATGMVLGYEPQTFMSPGGPKQARILNKLDNKVSQLMMTDPSTLSAVVQTEFDVGSYHKFFGTVKGTVKGSKLDIPYLLGQMEYLEKTGILAQEGSLDRHFYKTFRSDTKSRFGDIDFLIGKNPLSNFRDTSRLAPKSAVDVIELAFLNAAKQESALYQAGIPISNPERRFLNQLLRSTGFRKNLGRWESTGQIGGYNLIESLNSFAQKQGTSSANMLNKLISPNIVGGVVEKIPGILALEQHRIQMGIGGLGSVSQRAFLNIISMFPETATSLKGRLVPRGGISPESQYMSIAKYRSILGDASAEVAPLSSVIPHLDDLFTGDIEKRANVIRRAGFGTNDFMSIGLGTDINTKAGMLRNVVLSSNRDLVPYIGSRVGSTNLTDIDRYGLETIQAVRSGDTLLAQETARKYQDALRQAQNSIQDNLLRGKVRGSLWAQAQSELPGMRSFAESKLGLTPEGRLPPIIAVDQKELARRARDLITDDQLNGAVLAEIRKKYTGARLDAKIRQLRGQTAVTMAEEGRLWAYVTREPAEALQRTAPALVTTTQAVGGPRSSLGIAHVSGSAQLGAERSWVAMREAMGLDFDLDPLSVVFMTDDKANQTFRQFWLGGSSEAAAMGEEYRKTQFVFEKIRLKNRMDFDVLTSSKGETAQLLAEIGATEKGLIGAVSTEFEDVHIAHRQMLAQHGQGAMRDVLRGEALAVLAIESGLKAKHQSAKSLLAGDNILDIIRGGNPSDMQDFFDRITFGSVDLGREVRSAREINSGLAANIAQSAGVTELEAHDFARTYKDLTSIESIEKIFEAKQRGAALRRQGFLSESLTSELSMATKIFNRGELMGSEIAPLMTKGLKNIGKYAILPAAAVGLAGTLLGGTPEPLSFQSSSQAHEDTTSPVTAVTSENKIYAKAKKERFKISGTVKRVPHPSQLSDYFEGSNVNINVSDYRHHMTQDYIDRKVERGI